MAELVIVVRTNRDMSNGELVRTVRAIGDAVPDRVMVEQLDTDRPEAQIALLRARASIEERLWEALRERPAAAPDAEPGR